MTRALLVLALVGCHGAKLATVTGSTDTPAAAQGDPLEAVVATKDALYLFSPGGVSVVRGGAVAGHAPVPRGHGPWSAALVRALDGDGAWIVAARGGHLVRVTAGGDLEPLADRLGLGDARVLAVAGADRTLAVELPDAVALTADGTHMTRIPVGPTLGIAAAPGLVAVGTKDCVVIYDLAHGTSRTFTTPALVSVHFIGAELVVETRDALYVGSPTSLARVARPARCMLATSGARLWCDTAYILLGTRFARVASTAPASRAIGDGTGAAWTPAATRISLVAAEDPEWLARVAPVFQRACARCHLPGGDAGFDLSTAAAWRGDRDELRHRVVETRTMPPAGIPLSDADRAALAAWIH
ncbi:MAG TPA: cytochrome c [Kofleriaceae bacterium]